MRSWLDTQDPNKVDDERATAGVKVHPIEWNAPYAYLEIVALE